MTTMNHIDRCLRVPRAEPPVCSPVGRDCGSWASDCSRAQRTTLSHYEVLDRFPSIYARELTDAQVDELLFIAEHGGARYPDGSRQEIYTRLRGQIGRRPPGASERHHYSFQQVRPALIEHGKAYSSRAWRLTRLGRAVLDCFYCRVPRARVAQEDGFR